MPKKYAPRKTLAFPRNVINIHSHFFLHLKGKWNLRSQSKGCSKLLCTSKCSRLSFLYKIHHYTAPLNFGKIAWVPLTKDLVQKSWQKLDNVGACLNLVSGF